MAKPGFNYKEPDCCNNCIHSNGTTIELKCVNKDQLSLKGNKPKGSGYFWENAIFVEPFGKCDLYKRKKK